MSIHLHHFRDASGIVYNTHEEMEFQHNVFACSLVLQVRGCKPHPNSLPLLHLYLHRTSLQFQSDGFLLSDGFGQNEDLLSLAFREILVIGPSIQPLLLEWQSNQRSFRSSHVSERQQSHRSARIFLLSYLSPTKQLLLSDR